MCFPATLGWLSGSHDFWGRAPADGWEDFGYHTSSTSQEHHTTEIICGNAELLWKISSQSLYPISTTLQFTDVSWKWGQQQQKFGKKRNNFCLNQQYKHIMIPTKTWYLRVTLHHIEWERPSRKRWMMVLNDQWHLLQSQWPHQRKFSQIDEEGLAIIVGVIHFHQYRWGRRFNCFSLVSRMEFPPWHQLRILCWALTVSAYDYQIHYKPGKDHANADMLCRLPLPESEKNIPVPEEVVLLMEALNSSPIDIKTWSDHDPILSHVRMQGWQQTEDVEIQPYQRRKEELSVQDGCLLWGSRVIVPRQGRSKVIEELHEGHPGVSTNEKFSSKLCLVSKDGSRIGGKSEKLRQMSKW